MKFNKLHSFTQLTVWQKAHELSLIVYKVTDRFPTKETFGLISQMRRAGVSITSNIAEGFGRRNKKEKQQFYYIAKGSVTELQSQLILSKDLAYLDTQQYSELFEKTIEIVKMLNSLISSIP